MIAVPDGARLRRTWPQRLLIALMVVVMLVSFATAGALAYVDKKVGQLQQISLGHVLAADDTQAADDGVQNILVVGVDNDAGLEDDPRMEGRDEGLRSDTIMVLRIDPATSKAALLSFPRDLYVPLGGDGGRDRINAALPFGGPDLLIRTITENFGIQINHYVQVNFAQFEKLVDVVGGVPISFDKPVRDEWTGLAIEEPGCITLSGPQALDYVRSRHFEYFEDGEWNEDPAADLSRISRQQDFIQKAVERAASKGLRNPITMNRLLDAGLERGDRRRSVHGGGHRLPGQPLPLVRPEPVRDVRPAGVLRHGRRRFHRPAHRPGGRADPRHLPGRGHRRGGRPVLRPGRRAERDRADRRRPHHR